MKEIKGDIIKRKMNAYGKARKPFLAVISYDMETNLFFDLMDIKDDYLRFSFPEMPGTKPEKHIVSKPIIEFTPPQHSSYQKAFDKVSKHISRGNSYLCNLSFEVPLESDASIREIFDISKARYKLWVRDRFVCFSPESFVRISENTIKTFPMKGTIDADLPDAKSNLLNDSKEQAEHYTITDLLRNDLSIIADDVEVSRYRYIDSIETNRNRLLQTSTEITGTLPENWQATIGDMFFKLLPAGSITGAPKKKTVKIISEVENHQRGFYTGVTCLFDGERADSFVMIRMITEQEGKMFYKSGGGITSFSDADKEYEELIQKIYVPVY